MNPTHLPPYSHKIGSNRARSSGLRKLLTALPDGIQFRHKRMIIILTLYETSSCPAARCYFEMRKTKLGGEKLLKAWNLFQLRSKHLEPIAPGSWCYSLVIHEPVFPSAVRAAAIPSDKAGLAHCPRRYVESEIHASDGQRGHIRTGPCFPTSHHSPSSVCDGVHKTVPSPPRSNFLFPCGRARHFYPAWHVPL